MRVTGRSAEQDRTAVTVYNADGQVKTLTAKNPTTGDQVTKYIYGSTLAESGIASSQLLRAVIYPDSDDSDAPLGNGADGIYDRMEYKYNRQGERIELKDQRETVHVYDHDKLGRLIHDRVTELGSPFGTPVFSSSSSGSSSSSSSVAAGSSSSSSSGPGHVVDGSVRRISRTYEVRGMLKNVTSHDNATVGAGNVVNDVEFVYNTFGQLVTEYQEHAGAVSVSTTPKVQYAYADGGANHVRRTKMTYPNGRILRYEHNSGADDNLGRVSFLADDNAGAVGTHLAEYTYLGFGTIVKVDYTEPDLRLDRTFGAGSDPYDGLDRFDRVVDCLWRNYSTSTDVERIKHGYDRASNRLWRENTVAPAGFDELYSYDGLYQLENLDRGDLNAAKDAITGLTFAQEWSLDATGNWTAFKEDADGNGAWDLNQSRTHNKVNEIATIGASAGADWVDPIHDRAGNMVLVPQPADPTMSYTATWDAWNRLMKLLDGAATVGQYAYNGMNRRTRKAVSGTTRHFYYTSRWQVLEERVDTSTSADRHFVWGLRYIDDLVLRDHNADGSAATGNLGIAGSGLEERLYSLQDANWNVTGIADASGAIQERYRYDAYGTPTTMTGAFGSRATTIYNWETQYAGYRLDAETLLYHVRRRLFHPGLGRFISRDQIPTYNNYYFYVAGRPTIAVDPLGLCICDDGCEITRIIIVPLDAAKKDYPNATFRNPRGWPKGGADLNKPGPHQDLKNGKFNNVHWIVIEGRNLNRCTFRRYKVLDTSLGGRGGTDESSEANFAPGQKIDNTADEDGPQPRELYSAEDNTVLVIADAPGSNPGERFPGVDNAEEFHMKWNFLIEGTCQGKVVARVWYDVVIEGIYADETFQDGQGGEGKNEVTKTDVEIAGQED